METSPLLARRTVPVKERLQKSLLVLLSTLVAVGGVWIFAGASADIEARFLLMMAAIAALGLIVALYFWFKKEDRAVDKEGYRSVRRRIEDDRQGRGWLSRVSHNLKRFLTGVIVAIGLLIALAGVGVFVLQVYGFLKTGSWSPVSVLSVATPYVPWLSSPQSWFGLNRIIREASGILPLSLALVLLGWIVAGFGSSLRQRGSR
ncbi:MAG: hypothetical protein ACR2QZ_03035 [Woeseiaceae bacterium]